MGFLGSISNYITPAVQAAGGIESGKLQGVIEKIKLDKQAKDDALKTALQMKTMQNLDSEIGARENPKGTIFDQDGNAYERLPNGHLRPAQIDAAAVTPPAATGGPSGDIDLLQPQGAQAPKAPVTAAPKFGPRKPPDPVKVHQQERDYDVSHPVPDKPDRTLVPVQALDGSVSYVPRSQAAGQRVPAKAGTGSGNLAAPMAAKVGQFGEMLKKASDLMPATDALNVSLGNSAGQDIATHGVGIGSARVPGTQGVGSMMVNHSPEYSTYQAALSPFILAAAHALSGARINDTQVQQIRASIEIKPGDTPKVRAQKHKNVVDLINSIGGSLPAEAIGSQEDQMDPNSMALLKGYGYKAAARGAKTGGSSGDINLGSAKPALNQAQYDAGRAKHTDAEIAQHYDLSGVRRSQ